MRNVTQSLDVKSFGVTYFGVKVSWDATEITAQVVPDPVVRPEPVTYILRHVLPSPFVPFSVNGVVHHFELSTRVMFWAAQRWRLSTRAPATPYEDSAEAGRVFLACFGDDKPPKGETQLWRIDATGAHQLVFFER